jgi:hypothetical protein
MISLRLAHNSHPKFTVKYITITGLHFDRYPSVVTLITLVRLDDEIPVYVIRELHWTEDVTLPRLRYPRVRRAVEQNPLPEVGT